MGVLSSEETPRSSKPKRRNVINVLEWARCFALYTSILSRKQPQRVPDLLGYQSLILLTSMAFEGDGWQGYDRVFRQNAAANSLTTWTTIDGTLWGVAFNGKRLAPHCKHCFSFSHFSADCAWATDTSIPHASPPSQSSRSNTTSNSANFVQRRPRICLAWNNYPYPGCPFPNCSYDHSCAYCFNSPSIQDKGHKARFCPYQPQQPNRGPNNYNRRSAY